MNHPFVSDTQSGWLCSALTPVIHLNDHVCIAVGVDLSMDHIHTQMLETIRQKPDAAPKEMIENIKASIDDFVKDTPQMFRSSSTAPSKRSSLM